MRKLAGAVIVLLLALATPAVAAEPRATLADIEDEVMCLECGTTLNLSNAPVTERQREFIRRQIALGKTKPEIKAALVERLGPGVLALPDDQGFGLAAYLVPVVALLLGLVAVVAVVRRGRRPAPEINAPSRLDPADARRLERELARYDG